MGKEFCRYLRWKPEKSQWQPAASLKHWYFLLSQWGKLKMLHSWFPKSSPYNSESWDFPAPMTPLNIISTVFVDSPWGFLSISSKIHVFNNSEVYSSKRWDHFTKKLIELYSIFRKVVSSFWTLLYKLVSKIQECLNLWSVISIENVLFHERSRVERSLNRATHIFSEQERALKRG